MTDSRTSVDRRHPKIKSVLGRRCGDKRQNPTIQNCAFTKVP